MRHLVCLWTMLIFFAWVIWIWMVVAVLADVFGRHDISGWGKAAWVVFVIVLPFLGVLMYLITNSGKMAERRACVEPRSNDSGDSLVQRPLGRQ